MKEKRSFKRFDLFSVLAVLGVLLMLFFESIFIFELYMGNASKLEPYLPAALKSYFIPVDPEADPIIEPSVPTDTEELIPIEIEKSEPVG